ncbi:C40 family peptidase [Bacillus cereus]|uniref:C40 family peptidase n=1 Tax=Bacillus cereus TaxID=1396 RepID=UPI0038233E0C
MKKFITTLLFSSFLLSFTLPSQQVFADSPHNVIKVQVEKLNKLEDDKKNAKDQLDVTIANIEMIKKEAAEQVLAINQVINEPVNDTPVATSSNPSTHALALSNTGNAVVAEAYKHIGKPYVWGAKGPDSFDASGFTSYVYSVAAGREIGGWTVPQESAGTRISLSQLAPGDLVFWGAPDATHHVGIYVGGGQYIHAPQPGASVTVQSMSACSPDFGVRM